MPTGDDDTDPHAEDIEALYRDKMQRHAPKYAPVVMRADVGGALVFHTMNPPPAEYS